MKNGLKNGPKWPKLEVYDVPFSNGISGQFLGHLLGHFLPFSISDRAPVAQKVARNVHNWKLMYEIFSNDTLGQFLIRYWGHFLGQNILLNGLPVAREVGEDGDEGGEGHGQQQDRHAQSLHEGSTGFSS